MTDGQQLSCHTIIHSATAAAGAVAGGLAQIPAADIPALIGIEVAMITSLAAVFGVSLTRGAIEGMAKAKMAESAGRVLAGVLIGWIPGFGNAVKAGVAVTMVESIGWQTVKEFEKAA